MKYLLDTCVLLWALEANEYKIKNFIEILNNPNNHIAVSVVSYWEIVIKKSLGKLRSPDNLMEIVEETGFSWINLETRHIKQLEILPIIHYDPFDRLLISQAKSDKLQLLTNDKEILNYF